MSTEPRTEMTDRLSEILDEIKALADEAVALVGEHDRAYGTDARTEAEAFWYAHLRQALDRDHEFLGSSMTTMQDTIDRLEEGDEEQVPDLEAELADEADETE